MVPVLVAALLLTVGPAVQQKPAPAKRPPKKPAPTCAKQIEPPVCERGWQLLETAEAEASGLNEPGMRAYSLLQIARPYAISDKTKAASLLNDAFTATLALPRDKDREKGMLQGQILVSLAPLAPPQVEELLPQAVAAAREPALRALLGYFEQEKRFEKAMEVINRIASESGFPYAAANSLMTSLPSDKTAERQQLFTAALSSFRTNPPDRTHIDFGGGDFTDLITKYWRELPVPLVREAIDEVLKNADRNTDKDAPPVRITVGWRAGNASLDSWYEYRLFQLLPVLRQIDSAATDSLLREHERVAQQFKAYSEAGSPALNMVGLGSGGYAPIRRTTEVPAKPLEQPDEALEKALAIEDANTRANALLSFARITVEGNPAAAKNFLAKLLDPVASQVSLQQQSRLLADAATLYLQLNDDVGTRKAVEAGVSAAEKLYADDNDSSKPNTAMKAFWPSTSAWIRLARLASRISPDMALAIVKEVRDDDIRPLVRISLAGAWIGAPLGQVTVINKTGGWTQYSDPEVRR